MIENLEIERSWLLKTIPVDLTFDRTINQYYIPTEEGSLRVRQSCFADNSEVYHETKKYPRPNGKVGFIEHEREISRDEFVEMVQKAETFIFKNRFLKKGEGKNKGLTWEVDVFTSIHLVRVEIELPNDETEVEIEEWLKEAVIMETTGMKEFSNYNLSKKLVF